MWGIFSQLYINSYIIYYIPSHAVILHSFTHSGFTSLHMQWFYIPSHAEVLHLFTCSDSTFLHTLWFYILSHAVILHSFTCSGAPGCYNIIPCIDHTNYLGAMPRLVYYLNIESIVVITGVGLYYWHTSQTKTLINQIKNFIREGTYYFHSQSNLSSQTFEFLFE